MILLLEVEAEAEAKHTVLNGGGLQRGTNTVVLVILVVVRLPLQFNIIIASPTDLPFSLELILFLEITQYPYNRS